MEKEIKDSLFDIQREPITIPIISMMHRMVAGGSKKDCEIAIS